MPLTPAYVTGKQQTRTTRILTEARDIFTRRDILALLATHTKAGAPPTLGQYSNLGLLCTMWELTFTGQPISVADIVRRNWCDYTDEQLTLIDHKGLRCSKRLDTMLAVTANGDPTDHDYTVAEKTLAAEYQRCWQALKRLCTNIDDSPLPGLWRKENRPTNADVQAARTNPSLANITQAQHDVINRIIAAGLDVSNEAHHPGTTIHEGILTDHLGDIAIDETHIPIGLADKGDGKPHKRAAATMLGGFDPHNRRLKWGASIGITLAVTVGRPYGLQVPTVAAGIALHRPTSGDVDGAMLTLDAINANGLRPKPKSNLRQLVITDKGYTVKHGYNRGLNARNYAAVMAYPKSHGLTHRLRDSTGADTGITLYQGVPVCPGAGRNLLTHRLHAPLATSGKELLVHADKANALAAVTMSTNGAPKLAPGKRAGGQPKDGPEPTPTMQLVVGCPAARGHARCPVIAATMEHEAMANKPLVPHPPTDRDTLPKCCTQKWVTLNLPDAAMKQYQPTMEGTWEHTDSYSSARARNEWFNSRLIAHNQGGNLRHGQISFRRNGPVALAIAISVAVTNSKNLKTWEKKVRNNGGNPPNEAGIANRQRRHQIVTDYLNRDTHEAA